MTEMQDSFKFSATVRDYSKSASIFAWNFNQNRDVQANHKAVTVQPESRNCPQSDFFRTQGIEIHSFSEAVGQDDIFEENTGSGT